MTPAQARAAMQRAARDAQRADERQRQAVRNTQRVAKKQQDAFKHALERQDRAVREYNREVRQYNARARLNNQKVENQRRRLIQELNRLQSRPVTVRVTYRSSVQHLATTYDALEHRFQTRELSSFEQEFLDRASEEAANSAYLANALEGDVDEDEMVDAEELSSPSVAAGMLGRLSQDLVSRWSGALFSLNPTNPDAARHFCTSAREVVTSILDLAAPDSAVLKANSACEVTPERGTPTRRAKIRYLLSCKGIADISADEFVEADIDNVVSLFTSFNQGTHGAAGHFSIPQLSALRTRVEASISFLASIS